MLSPDDRDVLLDWLSGQEDPPVIIGGQAVALWQEYLQVPDPVHTKDIDFLNGEEYAEQLALLIDGRCYFPDLSSITPDMTPNSAVIMDESDPADPQVLADFVASPRGISPTDIAKQKVEVPHGEGRIYLMHPYHCLESKLSNYLTLPSKRDALGLAQLVSSVRVCRAYGVYLLDKAGEEKAAIALTNRILDLAESTAGKQIFVTDRIDFIDALAPATSFMSQDFQDENLPRRLAVLAEKRARYQMFWDRHHSGEGAHPRAPGE